MSSTGHGNLSEIIGGARPGAQDSGAHPGAARLSVWATSSGGGGGSTVHSGPSPWRSSGLPTLSSAARWASSGPAASCPPQLPEKAEAAPPPVLLVPASPPASVGADVRPEGKGRSVVTSDRKDPQLAPLHLRLGALRAVSARASFQNVSSVELAHRYLNAAHKA